MSRAARDDTPANPLQCRTRAAHIRELAFAISDAAALERLNGMALKFDQQAEAMEREAAEMLNASSIPLIQGIDR